MELVLERFILKPLTEDNVTDKYLKWFEDEDAKRYIDYSKHNNTKDDLRNYIRSKINRRDVLFLGIFNRTDMSHIGNIKYEPIDYNAFSATMGILIGEKEWRGKKVGPEVIKGSALWLKQNHNINRILLGVDRFNIPAVKAYKKIGFEEIIENSSEDINKPTLKMELCL